MKKDNDERTSWSEAPAESIFSTWQFVIDHRPSLTTKHVEDMCRVIRDGPKASSKEAEVLMELACKNSGASCGLRFITQNWQPGTTSKIVEKYLKS